MEYIADCAIWVDDLVRRSEKGKGKAKCSEGAHGCSTGSTPLTSNSYERVCCN